MKIEWPILAAALVLRFTANLHAEPTGHIIYPDIPRIHPGDALIRPSFGHLIPSSLPVIHPGNPTVYPGDCLVHPMEMPLVPKCIP